LHKLEAAGLGMDPTSPERPTNAGVILAVCEDSDDSDDEETAERDTGFPGLDAGGVTDGDDRLMEELRRMEEMEAKVGGFRTCEYKAVSNIQVRASWLIRLMCSQ
jgi:hypothetical protein